MNRWAYFSIFPPFRAVIFFVFIAACTKSAQIPFSAWLPQAIAAPTPVSSLVHSSTLVTAGVYLAIRNPILINLKLIQLSASITLLFASFLAIFEFDFKKIIALSTLSQIALIFFSLTHCTRNISYFHLLSHAVFKCLLFLSSGIMLHSANSIQDIRTLQFYHSKSVNFTLFLTGNISLVGFPFLTGFFSKDTIYENFLGHSGGGSLLILLSIICTAAYRIKLFLILSVPRNPKNFLEESSDYKIIRLRSIGLWVFVFTFGRIGWLISLNFWYLYKIYWPIKLLPLLMLIQGSFLGYKLKNSHLYFPSIMGLIPIRTAFLVHQQSLLKFLLYIELRISFTPTSFFINSAIHQLLFKPNFYLRIMLVVIISSYVFWI